MPPSSYARFIVPLDVSLIATTQAAGNQFDTTIAGRPCTIHTPALEEGVVRAPTPYLKHATNWGSVVRSDGSGGGQLAIDALGMSFSILPDEISIQKSEVAHGFAKGLQDLEVEALKWAARMTSHGETVLGQALDLFDPSPKVLNRPHQTPLKWLDWDGESSWIDSSPTALVLTMDTVNSHRSERACDLAAMNRIVSLAETDTAPPAAVELVTSARVQAQRDRLRVSLMELGTALEALLTDALNLGDHGMTLGNLLPHVRARHGVALPHDVHASFVVPRNDAVHKNVRPSIAQVDYGLELLDSLVASYYPDYCYAAAMDPAWRPQRMDLALFIPDTGDRRIPAAPSQPSESAFRRAWKRFRRNPHRRGEPTAGH